jgi:hypothetical protein
MGCSPHIAASNAGHTVALHGKTAKGGSAVWGEDPIGTVAAACYFAAMNTFLVLLVLLLLFGGGGFYFGGPAIGGGIGLILLICLAIYCVGGFRTKT